MAVSNDILNFKEWSAANPSIPFDKRAEKYDEYLKLRLVNEVIVQEGEQLEQTKEMYKSFLRRISVIYNDDPEIIQLSNVDLDDTEQLTSVIPIFANKIRDIALFYGKKRRELSDKKIELSTKGSVSSIEQSIRDLFLNRYSINTDYQDPTIDDLEVLSEIPNREDIINSLNINIVDKYNVTAQHSKPNNSYD